MGRDQPAARRRTGSTACARRSSAHLVAQDPLYVVDAFAGADEAHRIGVRVITASPYHALFAKTMFITPTAEERHVARARRRRPACARGRGRSGAGRHPLRHVRRPASDARGGADRRHLLRRRDQEGDLHGDERPAAARGRVADALLGERRRGREGRGLLRPLRHGQDDALRRSRALADRRRRARLGSERRLQHRGRLLREGDPALGRGRARDLPDDEDVRHGARERRRRRARSDRPERRRRRRRTRVPPTSSSGSRMRCGRRWPATRARS